MSFGLQNDGSFQLPEAGAHIQRQSPSGAFADFFEQDDYRYSEILLHLHSGVICFRMRYVCGLWLAAYIFGRY